MAKKFVFYIFGVFIAHKHKPFSPYPKYIPDSYFLESDILFLKVG